MTPSPGISFTRIAARFAAVFSAVIAVALTTPVAASAHGLVGRSDLPIPGWLFGWAAMIVLAVSFFAFAALWQEPKLEIARPRERFRVPVLVAPICGAIGVLVLLGLIYVGLAGEQADTDNLVPTFVYVIFWSLLPLISAIFGDIFRAFNPWLAIARAGRWVFGRIARRQIEAPLRYPEALGRWPAVLLLLGFGFLELVAPNGRDPSVLAWLIVAYTAIQLIGMSMFGIERWIERGDAFSVLFNVFSRISPFTVINGRFATRLPLSGLTEVALLPATVAFFVTAIGITTFDGASEGGLWQSIADPLESAIRDVGFAAGTATQIAGTIGLVGAVLLIAGFYRLGVEGMRSGEIDLPQTQLARMFAPSLVPIMLAYVLAHYFSFIMFQGQALWPLISDPLGNGSNYFGTAGAGINYSWLSSSTIWYVQAGVLVTGHAAGLALAHDKALAVWGKAKAAVRSQLWMLVVMVGFTNLGLWLLSQANQ